LAEAPNWGAADIWTILSIADYAQLNITMYIVILRWKTWSLDNRGRDL
jgi:hypothetical protein